MQCAWCTCSGSAAPLPGAGNGGKRSWSGHITQGIVKVVNLSSVYNRQLLLLWCFCVSIPPVRCTFSIMLRVNSFGTRSLHPSVSIASPHHPFLRTPLFPSPCVERGRGDGGVGVRRRGKNAETIFCQETWQRLPAFLAVPIYLPL